jgi:hypothetical protein
VWPSISEYLPHDVRGSYEDFRGALVKGVVGVTTPDVRRRGRLVTPTSLWSRLLPLPHTHMLVRGSTTGSANIPSSRFSNRTEHEHDGHSNRLTHSSRGCICSWYDAPFRPDVYAMEQFILRALGRGDLAAADDDSEGDDDEDTQSEQSCWSCNR